MSAEIANIDNPGRGEKTGIWFALLIALAIHVAILFLPTAKQSIVSKDDFAYLEVELTESISATEELAETVSEPEFLPEPASEAVTAVPEPLTEFTPTEAVAEKEPVKPQGVVEPPQSPMIERPSYDSLTSAEKTRLTNTILSAQFITEESVTDQIFGRQLVTETSDPQPGFHIPMRESMMTLLDQPMQELPFAYTPGLVHFAYDPGVKGDLQRFWDVITPEFGWRTKNGTEFKCVWVLIVAGCGWK